MIAGNWNYQVAVPGPCERCNWMPLDCTCRKEMIPARDLTVRCTWCTGWTHKHVSTCVWYPRGSESPPPLRVCVVCRDSYQPKTRSSRRKTCGVRKCVEVLSARRAAVRRATYVRRISALRRSA